MLLGAPLGTTPVTASEESIPVDDGASAQQTAHVAAGASASDGRAQNIPCEAAAASAEADSVSGAAAKEGWRTSAGGYSRLEAPAEDGVGTKSGCSENRTYRKPEPKALRGKGQRSMQSFLTKKS